MRAPQLMDCEQVREILLDYRERELGSDQQIKVAEHLRLCPECSKELQRLNSLLSAVAALPAPDPWPGFSRRLRARIAEQETIRPRGPRRASQPVLYRAGTAIALAVFAGWAAWLLGLNVEFTAPVGSTHQRPSLAGRPEVFLSQESSGTDSRPSAGRENPPKSPFSKGGLESDSGPKGRDETEAKMAVEVRVSRLPTMTSVSAEEVVGLWSPGASGRKGMEGLVEIIGSPDSIVEEFLDRISK